MAGPPVGPGPVEMPDEVDQPAAECDLIVRSGQELEEPITVGGDGEEEVDCWDGFLEGAHGLGSPTAPRHGTAACVEESTFVEIDEDSAPSKDVDCQVPSEVLSEDDVLPTVDVAGYGADVAVDQIHVISHQPPDLPRFDFNVVLRLEHLDHAWGGDQTLVAVELGSDPRLDDVQPVRLGQQVDVLGEKWVRFDTCEATYDAPDGGDAEVDDVGDDTRRHAVSGSQAKDEEVPELQSESTLRVPLTLVEAQHLRLQRGDLGVIPLALVLRDVDRAKLSEFLVREKWVRFDTSDAVGDVAGIVIEPTDEALDLL